MSTHSSEPIDGESASEHPSVAGLTAEEHAKNPRFVHPESAKLFECLPFLHHIPVAGPALEGFGPKVFFSLGMCYFMCKGVADQIIGFSRSPMMRIRFGIDATRYQRLSSMYSMGWAIKAFVAALTDMFAFLGYTKRWYMVISCVFGAAFALGYGLLPAKPSSANIAAGFIFLTCLGKANVDILSEGHYSRLMRHNPQAGPALISWIWWMILLGSVIASVIQGPLSDNNIMQVGVFVSAGLQILTSIFFIFNWYGEETNATERAEDARMIHEDLKKDAKARKDAGEDVESNLGLPQDKNMHPELEEQPIDASEDGLVGFSNDAQVLDNESFEIPEIPTCLCGIFEFNREVFFRNWRIVAYSGLMTASVITMVCVNILGTTWQLMYTCIVISVVNCVAAFFALPLVIAKAQVFIFFFFVLYIQLPGALDYFYMADEACLPGGPHFSYTFYNTIAAVISNIGGIAGVTLFTYVFYGLNYQVTLCVTVFIQILASLFDIIILERWNVYIGIPDHAMYIMGDAIVYQICYMLAYMPNVVLMSRLCPRGSESMVYALMAGFANLGQTMSQAIGSLWMETCWPVKSDLPCDFSNCRWLVITGHLGAPLLIIPLAFLLLPHARICDDIDVNGHLIKQVEEERAAAKVLEHEEKQEPYAEEKMGSSGDERH